MKKPITLLALLLSSLAFSQNYSPSTLSYLNLLFPNIIQHTQVTDILVEGAYHDTTSILFFNKNAGGDYTSGYEIDKHNGDTAHWSCGINGNLNSIIIQDRVLLADTLQMEEIYSDAQNRDTLLVAYADTGGFGISKYQEFRIGYGNNGFNSLIFYYYNNGTRQEFLNFTPVYGGNGLLTEINMTANFGGFNLPAQTLLYDYQGLAMQNVFIIDRFNNNDTIEKVKPNLNPAYQITGLNFMEKDSAGNWVVYNIIDFSNQNTSVGMSDRSAASVSLFPNPVRDWLNVRSELEEVELSVYSNSGALISEPIKGEKINTAELRPGLYILQAKSSRGIHRFKFIKEN